MRKLLFKSPVSTGFFILVTFCLMGCPFDTQKVSIQPVIQVNDRPLSAKEFSSQLGRRLKDLDAVTAKNPATIDSAKQEIVKSFVTQSLIIEWCRAKSINVSDADVDKEVEKLRAGYPDDLAFRRSLAGEDLSFSEWREELRYTLVERAFFAKMGEKIPAPTEEEIKSYFAANRDKFKKKERVYLRQIVSDDASRADMLRAEIIKKRDFSELAKKFSIAPEASSGGVVGWVEKGSVDFFDSAFSLGAAGLSQVIHSPFGYHILKVDKKLPASQGTLDEARPQVARTLKAQREQAAFVSWLDGEIRSAKILKNNELIRSLRVETRSRDE